ncbi:MULTISPECIES: hypothetical protein [unclassified Microcoleus]|uniref:hypothetical protein n=1 Tax=unclassified Microcoleus TaxID=2642155 RepID=UPI0025DD31AE|nr:MULTISPECIES: hypothetical protein [unclassified Microcoleus]
MKSRTTVQFRQMFAELPEQIQDQTRKAYRQFKQDPTYPSLRFKKVHPKLPIYSARINRDSVLEIVDGEIEAQSSSR